MKEEAMTTQEINKRFAELAGLYHYDGELKIGIYHISICNSDGPFDFCAFPVKVLEVMMNREDCHDFLQTLDELIDDYMTDTNGLLAMKGIEWMEDKL